MEWMAIGRQSSQKQNEFFLKEAFVHLDRYHHGGTLVSKGHGVLTVHRHKVRDRQRRISEIKC